MTTSDLEAIRPLIEDVMGVMGFKLLRLEPKGAGFYFSWRRGVTRFQLSDCSWNTQEASEKPDERK